MGWTQQNPFDSNIISSPCHACVLLTTRLPQVLPTSLTQLRLSYATNELGEAPEPMQILLAEIDPEADEGEGIMLTEECHWYDWVTPLVNGLARLTGAAAA